VLLSSHELDEVERACDRVGIIRAGQLIAVEEVSSLTSRPFHYVTLEFAEPVDREEFRRLPGVIELTQEGRRISFKATGALDAVIKSAAKHTVMDVELTHPMLGDLPHLLRGGGQVVSVVARPEVERRTAPMRPPSAAYSVRALVRRGLRDHRRAPLTWGGSLGAMSALMAAVWPSIEDSMDELMRSYPERLKEAFNIRSITSVEAYIDAEMRSLIVPLAIGLLAVRIVARALAGAEERGYLDTLLATPLHRRALVLGAFLTAAVVVGIVLFVIAALAWIAGTLVGADPSVAVLARGFANVWPLAVLFAGVAALAAG
jgi:hypothetical protein